MNVTPPADCAVAASSLISCAFLNHFSLSQTQFKAEPVVATKVSTAKCDTWSWRRAVIVSEPS